VKTVRRIQNFLFTDLPNRALVIFSEWFMSPRGVWQTFLITALIVIFELLFPHADPHGFWLLYWLTVYSAITQPALAYVGGKSSDHSEEVLKRIEGLEISILEIVRHLEDMKTRDNS
jgi:hypothetical protein